MSATPIRKALISAFGDVSNVAVVESTINAPAKNEVQCTVLDSGFSGADVGMRTGHYPMQKSAPLTPGYCFVGRVHTNGAACKKFTPGTLVMAMTVYDSEAERINIPEKYLIQIPPTLDASDEKLQQCAALVLDWNTAYGMVYHSAEVKAGQRVFIHGLSGAVGGALMRLSLLRGAKVYGTASARNHAALRAIGDVTPFVYTDKKWMDEMKKVGGAEVVFDALGFESWDESYEILSENGGLLVGYGGNKATMDGQGGERSQMMGVVKLLARNAKLFCKKKTTFYFITRDQKTFVPDLTDLMAKLEKGEIEVPIRGIWNLTTEGIRAAHENWGKSDGMGSNLIRCEKA